MRSAPAMPCTHLDNATPGVARLGKPDAMSNKRRHQHPTTAKGCASEFHYGLVHAPVSTREAMKIPEANTAAEKERNKFRSRPAWKVREVKPKAEVVRYARQQSGSRPCCVLHGPVSREARGARQALQEGQKNN